MHHKINFLLALTLLITAPALLASAPATDPQVPYQVAQQFYTHVENDIKLAPGYEGEDAPQHFPNQIKIAHALGEYKSLANSINPSTGKPILFNIQSVSLANIFLTAGAKETVTSHGKDLLVAVVDSNDGYDAVRDRSTARLLELYVDYGLQADVTMPHPKTKKPLFFYLKTPKLVQALLPNRINQTVKDHSCDLLSHICGATHYHDQELVSAYIPRGLELNTRNAHGETPITQAIITTAKNKSRTVFQKLFKAGCTLEAKAIRKNCQQCPSAVCKGHNGYQTFETEITTARFIDKDKERDCSGQITRLGALCFLQNNAQFFVYQKAALKAEQDHD